VLIRKCWNKDLEIAFAQSHIHGVMGCRGMAMISLKQVPPEKIEKRADECELIAELAVDARTRQKNEDKARRLREALKRLRPPDAES